MGGIGVAQWRCWAVRLSITLLTLAACTVPPPPTTPANTPTPSASPTPAPTATATPVPTIKIGALYDLTGATSAVAIPFAEGARLYLDQVNAQGGIQGRPLSLVSADYHYDVPAAVDAYKRLVATEHPVAFLGSGDLDTEALSWMIVQDKLPYLSPSYLGSLVESTADRPYSFLFGTTYSDQMRAALRYIKSNWQVKDRQPSVAFLFADNAYGRSPLSVGRGMAGQLDMKVADEQALPFGVVDALGQVSSIRRKGADFVIVNNLPAATAAALRAAAVAGYQAQFLTLNGGADEEVLRLAGNAAENLIAFTPFSFLAEDKPGFAPLKAAAQSQGIDPVKMTARQVQGWLAAELLVEGIKRADKVTGEEIKNGLETITEFDTGGITTPITWAKSDHTGNRFVRTYQVRNGVWVPLGEFTKVER